jgi:hypothetical protein
MLQEVPADVGWDLRSVNRTPTTSSKLLVLFMLVVFAVALVKLVKIWWVAPPFRLLRQQGNLTYLKQLETSSRSLSQWVQFSFLGWGIFISTSIYNDLVEIASEKVNGASLFLVLVADYAVFLTLTLWVVGFLFLARWHMLKRIERLKSLHSDSAT